MKTYYQTIEEEAEDFIENYKEEIDEIIKENKEKSNEYIFDEAIYQQWDLIDKIHEWLDSGWYGFLRKDWCDDTNSEFMASAKVLEESEEVETDTGLWEGQEPQDAIRTQAFFTVRQDLYFAIEKLLKEKL